MVRKRLVLWLVGHGCVLLAWCKKCLLIFRTAMDFRLFAWPSTHDLRQVQTTIFQFRGRICLMRFALQIFLFLFKFIIYKHDQTCIWLTVCLFSYRPTHFVGYTAARHVIDTVNSNLHFSYRHITGITYSPFSVTERWIWFVSRGVPVPVAQSRYTNHR